MKRRTRITLAAATLALAALGGTYGMVAQQPVPSAVSNTVAAATVAPAPSSSVSRSASPPVIHTRTRAS